MTAWGGHACYQAPTNGLNHREKPDGTEVPILRFTLALIPLGPLILI